MSTWKKSPSYTPSRTTHPVFFFFSFFFFFFFGFASCSRYAEDADLAKAAGFDGYRLSFAWSRIYPEGEGDVPNADGVQHYHDVLDALIDRGLEPMVTLYHWDLPQARHHFGWCG